MSGKTLVIVGGDLPPDVMLIFLNTGGGRKVVQHVSAVSGDMERLLGHGTLEGYVSVFVLPPVVNSELLPTGFQGESHV